jgi:hypothetical protein
VDEKYIKSLYSNFVMKFIKLMQVTVSETEDLYEEQLAHNLIPFFMSQITQNYYVPDLPYFASGGGYLFLWPFFLNF